MELELLEFRCKKRLLDEYLSYSAQISSFPRKKDTNFSHNFLPTTIFLIEDTNQILKAESDFSKDKKNIPLQKGLPVKSWTIYGKYLRKNIFRTTADEYNNWSIEFHYNDKIYSNNICSQQRKHSLALYPQIYFGFTNFLQFEPSQDVNNPKCYKRYFRFSP